MKMLKQPPLVLPDLPATYHENLFIPMFHKALPHIIGWATDLGHDVLILSHAKPGDALVWSWRETGTHLMDLEECFSPRVVVEQSCTPHPNWFLIQVEGRHGRDLRFAKGWMTAIGHDDADVVTARIIDARNRMLEHRVGPARHSA
jgi:hypothetical protein